MNDRINARRLVSPESTPDASPTQPDPTAVEPAPSKPAPANVLIVGPIGAVRRMAAEAISALGASPEEVGSAREARRIAGRTSFDVVLIDAALPRGSGYRLCEALSTGRGASAVVMLDGRPSLESATLALRSGACDLIGPENPAELAERVMAAADRGRTARANDERTRRLERLCNKLNTAREEVVREVGDLCGGLVGAYQDLSGEVGRIALASEFHGLVRQELEVEGLLRTTLEFMLAKIGSTNAGIFLPSSAGEYSLGAYINYDCPPDAAEVMLDHLADELAPRYENLHTLTRIDSDARLRADLPETSHWIEGRTMLVTGCHERPACPGSPTGQGRRAEELGECLAVLAVFRDRRSGFDAEAQRTVSTIADLFTEQLSRVIRVHHRHTPGDLDDGYDDGIDDLDLAA
jgi:FixJ family two-component response regulator